MPDVDFYRLYNGLLARDLMPCLCCVFAVIFAIFTKVCLVFTIFCRDFLLSLNMESCVWRSIRNTVSRMAAGQRINIPQSLYSLAAQHCCCCCCCLPTAARYFQSVRACIVAYKPAFHTHIAKRSWDRLWIINNHIPPYLFYVVLGDEMPSRDMCYLLVVEICRM